MKTLDQMADDIADEIKRLDVTDSEYENWKENKVTKRFLLEAQLAMIVALDEEDYEGKPVSVEETALGSAYVKGIKNTTEFFVKWEPFS